MDNQKLVHERKMGRGKKHMCYIRYVCMRVWELT